MVNVYDENNEIVAQVKRTQNLDYWDGNNMTCGSTGRHKGVTKLQNGHYVLVHSSQWQGESDSAEIISAEQAVQEILKSGDEGLLEEYPELKKLSEKTLIKEI